MFSLYNIKTGGKCLSTDSPKPTDITFRLMLHREEQLIYTFKYYNPIGLFCVWQMINK